MPSIPPESLIESVPTDGSLVRRFRGGNSVAAEEIYERYAGRIRALVHRRLSRGIASRIDADDIVQSVFRRFFHAAGQGRYESPTGEEIGELLVTITLNRVRSEEVFQRAERRDVRQTVGEEGLATQVERGEEESEAFLSLAVSELVEYLPVENREVIRYRLDGFEVFEIASRIGRSKRSVERLLQDTRNRLKSLLESDR